MVFLRQNQRKSSMNSSPDLDFRFPTTHQDVVVSTTATPSTAFAAASSSSTYFVADDNTHQNPRKKRSKLIRLDNPVSPSRISRPKYAKKPDPSAPKITKPCSECGKKFWSWKALFGHMRCHPERQWRGIDPPPNLRRPVSPNAPLSELEWAMGEADHEAASSLLMLASGCTNGTSNEITTQSISTSTFQGAQEVFDGGNGRFECSSCKKVFGSHQALGGHRASHKNVKGCFAITRTDGEVDQDHHHNDGDDGDDGDDDVMEENNKMAMGFGGSGHKCSVCWRVFSSGQALGGHMRCHWDEGDEPSSLSMMMTQSGLSQQQQQQPSGISKEGHSGGLDLNLPAASHIEDAQSSSSGLTLDLRLGL